MGVKLFDSLYINNHIKYDIMKIADVDTAEAGEHVWRYSELDTDADVILQADTTNGAIIVKKRSPLGDT